MKTEKLNARSLRKLREEQATRQVLVPNKLRAIRWVSGGSERCCNITGSCRENRFEELFVTLYENTKDSDFLKATKRYLLSTKLPAYEWLAAHEKAKAPCPDYRVFCWRCFKEAQRWEAKCREVRSH